MTTRVYPLDTAPNGLPLAGLPGVPSVVADVATKAEAEALVATGHFSLTPPKAPEPTTPDKE